MEFVSVPHSEVADKIMSGAADLIIKAMDGHSYIQKPILLISPVGAHGKVLLGRPFTIGLTEFRDLADRHGLSEDDRLAAWPGVRRLYAFKVVVIERFDQPLQCRVKHPLPAFGDVGEFAGPKPTDIQEIQDIEKYNADDQRTDQLLDDWRLLVAHYALHLRGKKSSWSPGTIKRLATEVAAELASRGIVFHPDKMTTAGRELFSFVLRRKPDIPHTLTDEELSLSMPEVNRLGKEALIPLHANLHRTWEARRGNEEVANLHNAVLTRLKRMGASVVCPDDGLVDALGGIEEEEQQADACAPLELVLVRDGVSLVGSTVYALDTGIEAHDTDILFREFPQWRIAELIGKRIDEKRPLHVLYAPFGPNWSYVPLGDFVLSNVMPRAVVERAPGGLTGLIGLGPILVMEAAIMKRGDEFLTDLMPDDGLRLKLERLFPGTTVSFMSSDSSDGRPFLDLWFVPHQELTVVRIKDSSSELQNVRAAYKPCVAFEPMKAKGGYHIGEFFSIDDAIAFWATPDRLKNGIIVEPKADGIRLVFHKRGGTIRVFTEDKQRDRSDVLPALVEAMHDFPDCILDAEVVLYDEDGSPVPRQEMVSLVVAKKPISAPMVAWVHDCLYWDGEEVASRPAIERIELVGRVLKGNDVFKPMPYWLVTTKEQLRSAFERAARMANLASDGAMLKEKGAGYGKEYAASWAKVKMARELKVKVIGVMRKAAPWSDGKGKEVTGSEAVRVYKELAAKSRTYLIRGAVIGPDGKLKAIESKKRLAPGDLELRWTGEEWRGLEASEIWDMAPGWEHRKSGELAYGTSYGRAFETPPKLGDIVTIRPMEMTIFEEGGEQHAAWMFPILHEVDPTRKEPDDWSDVVRIAEFTKKRHEVRAAEAGLTRDESRELIKKRLGYDWYVVKQPGNKLSPFVMQIHVRGILSMSDARACKEALGEAKSEADLERIAKRFGIGKLTEDLEVVRQRLQEADDSRAEVSLGRMFSESIGRGDRLYALGNAHLDFRIKHPLEDYLIGWTCDVGKVVLQPLDDPEQIIFLLRNRVLENTAGDQWLAQQKLSQPLVWLTLVSPKRKYFWREPGSVGATVNTGGCFIFAASGKGVYGVQKSEHYHEYFLRFDEFGDVPHKDADELNGRWDFKYIEGRYEKTGGGWFWQGSRPWKTQQPYIETHDFDEEEEKERRAHRQWEWNEDTSSAVRTLFRS